MERLSRHAAAAHFNMCNGAEIVFSLAYTGVNTAVVILKAIMIDKNLFNFIKKPSIFLMHHVLIYFSLSNSSFTL